LTIFMSARHSLEVRHEPTVCEFIYVRPHWTVVIAGNGPESQQQTVDRNVGNGSAASGARSCQDLPEPVSAPYRPHQHWRDKSTDVSLRNLCGLFVACAQR